MEYCVLAWSIVLHMSDTLYTAHFIHSSLSAERALDMVLSVSTSLDSRVTNRAIKTGSTCNIIYYCKYTHTACIVFKYCSI